MIVFDENDLMNNVFPVSFLNVKAIRREFLKGKLSKRQVNDQLMVISEEYKDQIDRLVNTIKKVELIENFYANEEIRKGFILQYKTMLKKYRSELKSVEKAQEMVETTPEPTLIKLTEEVTLPLLNALIIGLENSGWIERTKYSHITEHFSIKDNLVKTKSLKKAREEIQGKFADIGSFFPSPAKIKDFIK